MIRKPKARADVGTAGPKTATAKVAKPSPEEIARQVAALHQARAVRKEAEERENALKEWFKERRRFGPVFKVGMLIVELVERSRSALDKAKAEKLLGPAAWKKLLSCYKPGSYTEVQVREEGSVGAGDEEAA